MLSAHTTCKGVLTSVSKAVGKVALAFGYIIGSGELDVSGGNTHCAREFTELAAHGDAHGGYIVLMVL